MAKPPARAAGSDHPQMGCVWTLLFTLFLAFGVLIIWGFFLEPAELLVRSLRWRKTPCEIRISRIETAADSYKPDVHYRYRINGMPHLSSRIWIGKPEPQTAAEVKAFLARYPVGAMTFCYVDPAEAHSAVLERGFRPVMLIALLPLLLALTGAGGLAAQRWRGYRPASRQEDAPSLRWPLPSLSAPPVASEQIGDIRPIVYRVRYRWRPLGVAMVVAMVWNGLLWFLVREVIRTWSGGLPGCHGWMLTFFATPFVVVGLIMAGVAAYLFLKQFNPRPILRVAAGSIPLGQWTDIAWQIPRGSQRIRRLRISVEGREEATYTRGDDTVTERETFTTMVLADTTDKNQIRSGTVRFTAPGGTAPSFRSPHNRICWVLRVTGYIRQWPDVDDEVELQLLPAESIPTAARTTP